MDLSSESQTEVRNDTKSESFMKVQGRGSSGFPNAFNHSPSTFSNII